MPACGDCSVAVGPLPPSSSKPLRDSTTGSFTVAGLLAALVSVTATDDATVAVFEKAPGSGFVDTLPLIAYVPVPPAGRFTVWLMLPVPGVVQVAPPVAVQVHVAPVMTAGRLSVTVAPVTPTTPRLLATTVYCTRPVDTCDRLLVFVMPRSVVELTTCAAVPLLVAKFVLPAYVAVSVRLPGVFSATVHWPA